MFSRNQPLYLSGNIRSLEEAARAAHPGAELMERAGLAAAKLARELLGQNGTAVLIYAGPGNNGGDAFVVARHLRKWFFRVCVVFASDAAKLPPDAARALEKLLGAGGALVDDAPRSTRFDLAIDGLFGTGLARPLSARYSETVARINALACPVLALDVPSGLHSDTGAVMGSAVRADHTLTFIAVKPGLLTLDGPDHCGQLHVDTLGLDAAALLPPDGFALGGADVASWFGPRAKNSHKGDYGNVGIIGGASGMVGAALLAGRAALQSGAGRVYLGLLGADAPRVDVAQPELMLRNAKSVLALEHLSSLIVGPGMGQSDDSRANLAYALESKLPLVLDADALNLIASHPPLREKLRSRAAPSVLTPHPAEAARLLRNKTADVQANRIAAACAIARELLCLCVLKGAGSVCADEDGRWWINGSGNPGMASAGMGDVLCGVIGALLAQGFSAEQSLLAGVHAHGVGADDCVARGIGPLGLSASEVITAVRLVLNRFALASATD